MQPQKGQEKRTRKDDKQKTQTKMADIISKMPVTRINVKRDSLINIINFKDLAIDCLQLHLKQKINIDIYQRQIF